MLTIFIPRSEPHNKYILYHLRYKSIPDNKKTWYEIPNGITSDKIDPISGESKLNGYTCYYEKGSEPSFNYIEYFDLLSN